MSALRALIGRVSPCGCPVRVKLIGPDDTSLSIEQARDLMRQAGLRPQIVPAARLVVTPTLCQHGPRRPRPEGRLFSGEMPATAPSQNFSPRRLWVAGGGSEM